MADTHNQAEVKRRYPVVTGLTAEAKHESRVATLVPERGSMVAKRFKVGISD